MKYCPNRNCPHFLTVGRPAEFNDEIRICSDCKTNLVEELGADFLERTVEKEISPEIPLVIVGRFREPALAHLAKGKLESEGITSFVRDEYLVGVDWEYSLAIGGVKLEVAEEDAERAIEILKEDHSEDISEVQEGLGDSDSDDKCPKCGSGDLIWEKSSRKFGALALLFSLPLIFMGKSCKCRSCGYRWKPKTD